MLSKCHLDQGDTWGLIYAGAKFLSSCESVKPDKFCAPNIQWWKRHRIDINILKGKHSHCKREKQKRGGRSQASPKLSKANSLIPYTLRIILYVNIPVEKGSRGLSFKVSEILCLAFWNQDGGPTLWVVDGLSKCAWPLVTKGRLFP